MHKDFGGLPAWIVKSVGGSTIHWAGASLRFQDHEWKGKTTYGEVAGANLLDWPIDGKEMEPWYAKAEDRMGTTRTNGIEGLPGNNNFKIMKAGADKLGYKECHTGRMSINSAPRDGRGSCQQIGFCFQGCKSGAKWSTLYAEIPKGEKTGKLEVRPECHVTRIEHDDKGKVTGVVYFDKDGKEQKQKARAVCVAGNSIESPRLLLNSASSMFKDGLANSSGQVGRNYMRHTTGSVYGIFEKPVKMWRGTTMAGIVQDEARFDPKRGFVGGYELETLSLGLPFMAAFLEPGGWGREFTAAMDGYNNMAGMWIVGEDMPQANNRVTVNADKKDKFGMPTPNVTLRRPPQRHRHAQPCLQAGCGLVRSGRRDAHVPDTALSFDAQSRHQPDERRQEGRRRQQVRPDARHQEPVRLRRQPVHDRRRREPDAHHRFAGAASGQDDRRHDVEGRDLSSRNRPPPG